MTDKLDEQKQKYCDEMNKQYETIKRLEIELEDMTEIKEKYRKESNDYLDLYLDTKKQLSELGGSLCAKSLNLRIVLHKEWRKTEEYNHVDTGKYYVRRQLLQDIAQQVGVELE